MEHLSDQELLKIKDQFRNNILILPDQNVLQVSQVYEIFAPKMIKNRHQLAKFNTILCCLSQNQSSNCIRLYKCVTGNKANIVRTIRSEQFVNLVGKVFGAIPTDQELLCYKTYHNYLFQNTLLVFGLTENFFNTVSMSTNVQNTSREQLKNKLRSLQKIKKNIDYQISQIEAMIQLP
jgi:hypothetical protein